MWGDPLATATARDSCACAERSEACVPPPVTGIIWSVLSVDHYAQISGTQFRLVGVAPLALFLSTAPAASRGRRERTATLHCTDRWHPLCARRGSATSRGWHADALQHGQQDTATEFCLNTLDDLGNVMSFASKSTQPANASFARCLYIQETFGKASKLDWVILYLVFLLVAMLMAEDQRQQQLMCRLRRILLPLPMPLPLRPKAVRRQRIASSAGSAFCC